MFDPEPFSPLVYYSHLFIGTLGLAGALLALFARKGSSLHKAGGRLFILGAIVAAVSALIFVSIRFGIPPVVNAITALVGLATAVLALRPGSNSVRYAEYGLSLLLVVLLAWFVFKFIPIFQAGGIPIFGPITVVFVTTLFLIGDVRFFLNPHRRAKMNVQRHMSRMIWTMAIAIRAPLFELRDNWGLPLPPVLVGPLVLAIVLILVFWKRAGQMRSSYF